MTIEVQVPTLWLSIHVGAQALKEEVQLPLEARSGGLYIATYFGQ